MAALRGLGTRLIGDSPALARIRTLIQRVAPTDATVLLQGESGVGKELVAHALHHGSARRRGPFVMVNCAAIPEELIESELFGHERGSFTGATAKQIGKFERAHGGTIFLDEIGDMSPKTQAKVLRVLQEGEVERVGSVRTIHVDVRLIAATNKDLRKMLAEGKFREDLYFRLSIIPVVIPPLRERREDIPALVAHFSEVFARTARRGITIHPSAVAELQQGHWAGNVRELYGVLERLCVLTPDPVITAAHVREVLQDPVVAVAGPKVLVLPESLQASTQLVERTILQEALRTHGGSIRATAKALGLPRSSLYRRLQVLGISRETAIPSSTEGPTAPSGREGLEGGGSSCA